MAPPSNDPIARACALLDQARYADAAALLRRHLQKKPNDPPAVGALCFALTNLGQMEQAVFYARGLYRAVPGPTSAATLGEALHHCRLHGEAIELLTKTLQESPGDPQVGFVLAEALRSAARYAEAIEVCDRAIREGWASDAIRSVRATSMHKLGLLDEAMKFARESQWNAPGRLAPAEIAAVTINYDPDATAAQVTALHQRYGTILRDHVGENHFQFPATDDPDRPLRVGILSPDLRQHSVGFFALPMLRAMRGRFHVTAFYSWNPSNDTTARFRELVDQWIVVSNLSMAATASIIHHEKIDVLIDLAGLTRGQAMPVMSARPAPVQATYIGYPATTGVRAIDYRIVDSITDPPGSEGLAIEKLARLDPCFLCFEPWEAPPPVQPPAGDGPVTFGSFNNSMKINSRTLNLWRRVLEACPGSRLLVKALESDRDATNAYMLQRFEAHGIPASRLLWRTWQRGMADHLSSYGEVDVALDTFPYHGTTTTCEAMLMGVPVVSLAGDRHAARVGCSLLQAVGLDDLVAPNETRYVEIAAGLAGDLARRRDLRQNLRARMLASPLCDQAAFGPRFCALIRGIWHARCRG